MISWFRIGIVCLVLLVAAGSSLAAITSNSTSSGMTTGATGTDRNMISGNAAAGVAINGAGSTGNSIVGNYIGTDVTGTLAIGNTSEGITVSSGASNNTIGGTAPTYRICTSLCKCDAPQATHRLVQQKSQLGCGLDFEPQKLRWTSSSRRRAKRGFSRAQILEKAGPIPALSAVESPWR